MKLTRQPPEPARLMEFFEEALPPLGAVCERTWHDRLMVLAEGAAARLWREDGVLHEAALQFPEPTASGSREAATQVFAGCPLTFRLVEALWHQSPPQFQARLPPDLESDQPPARGVAEKVWHHQFGQPVTVDAAGWERVWQFALVATVRCAIQAIDQHWTAHRLAVAIPTGEADPHLEEQLDYWAGPAPPGEPVPWPALARLPWPDWLAARLRADLRDDLAVVGHRQQRYLARELERLDGYFEEYQRELRVRQAHQHKPEARARYDERLRAAQAEHQRRRDDQLRRHEIHVLPEVDALLLLAEPAWRTTASGHHRQHRQLATYVPRARRWVLAPP